MVALSSEHQSIEDISDNASKGIYYVLSPDDVTRSLETEERIYDTPCSNRQAYGPTYCDPFDEERKLLQEFERKMIQKLYHEDIKLVFLCSTYVIQCHKLLNESNYFPYSL